MGGREWERRVCELGAELQRHCPGEGAGANCICSMEATFESNEARSETNTTFLFGSERCPRLGSRYGRLCIWAVPDGLQGLGWARGGGAIPVNSATSVTSLSSSLPRGEDTSCFFLFPVQLQARGAKKTFVRQSLLPPCKASLTCHGTRQMQGTHGTLGPICRCGKQGPSPSPVQSILPSPRRIGSGRVDGEAGAAASWGRSPTENETCHHSVPQFLAHHQTRWLTMLLLCIRHAAAVRVGRKQMRVAPNGLLGDELYIKKGLSSRS